MKYLPFEIFSHIIARHFTANQQDTFSSPAHVSTIHNRGIPLLLHVLHIPWGYVHMATGLHRERSFLSRYTLGSISYCYYCIRPSVTVQREFQEFALKWLMKLWQSDLLESPQSIRFAVLRCCVITHVWIHILSLSLSLSPSLSFPLYPSLFPSQITHL